MASAPTEVCRGCGGRFFTVSGPTHKYMESSPGCWAAYGEVLAREYSDIRFARHHQLTVDSYAVQHPGRPSTQSIQSVGLHLVSLCLQLERGEEPERARSVLQQSKIMAQAFQWLEPPPARGEITVAEVVALTNPQTHLDMVQRWAESAWRAWSVHHPQVRLWIGAAV